MAQTKCLLLTGTFILLLAAGWHSCQSQTSSLPASSTRAYGYFNRTSRVTLAASTWSLRYTKEVTFRTCVPDGTLLAQAAASGSAGSARFFKLYLTNGSVVFQWNTTTGSSSSRIFLGSSLADNQQYTVTVTFDLGVINLRVQVGNAATYSAVVANSTFNSDLLSAGINSTDLLVGQNFTGCLFNGQGVNFGLPLVSENVVWNECPLLTRTGCSAVEDDGNDCYLSPCQNGGTCMDGYRSYTCHCPINFNGTNCQNDLARLYGCLIQPCLNNATCAVQSPSTTGGLPYRCNCAPGYTGQNCETELDECQKKPCVHGSCIRHVNGYTCNCTGTGYIGTNCSEDINECNSSPCGTGKCSNFPGSYSCDCLPGFGGTGCQDIDECLSFPCQNGGSCMDGVDRFTCQCPVGFNGSRCEHNIDDCIGKTCPVALTTCQDLVASYRCVCLPGYTGMRGSCTEINECSSSPCQNGGTCGDLINGYNCSCVSGFSGANCQTNIDDCAIRPCENNATCVDGINSYRCVCQPGFTSYNCSTNIDECLNNNCQNGATCVDLVNGFRCSCGIGWTGDACESDINDCASDPCLHGSTCVDHLGSYTCSCVPGYTGTNCQTDIDDCSPNPCQNGANCTDKVNDYICACTFAWMGRNCSEEYDACSFHPCQNNATCTSVKKQHNHTCSCVTGFSGQNCEINIDDCVGKTCGPYQRCFDQVNGYICACPTGYTGTTCSADIDECNPNNPCQHGGNCTNYIGGYNCTCKSGVLNPYDYRTGWTGVNCETDINECNYNPPICKNGGTCVNLAGSHKCNCNPQTDTGELITGYNCEVVTSYCTASGLVCENGGTCHSITGGFWCSCVPGYTGKNCSVNINECASAPCRNNGTCLDGINNYTCQCIPGITGSNCEINIDDCVSSPCGHGRCIDAINEFHCDCYDSGYTGDLCDININDCVNATCLHNSSCRDGIKSYSCACFQGYQGEFCQIDIRECDSNPCQFNGTCLEYSNQTLYSQGRPGFSVFSYATAAGYKCECIPGITGANCETNIDDCQPGVCLNNATCRDQINSYTCVCAPGYRGDHCQTEINECLEYTPCWNGATCHDLIADYSCQCPGFSPSAANYDGKNCSVYLRGCDAIHPCLHGQCIPLLLNEAANQHGYRCECDAGFTGRNCTQSTTMTFTANGSKVWFAPDARDSFSLSLRFRTTLRAAVLLLYSFSADNFVSLEIREGRLIIAYWDNSSMPVTQEVDSQDQVNNADWQQVFLSLDQNISLTLVSKTCGTQRCLTQFAYSQGKPNILQTLIFFGYLEPHLRQRTISQQTYVGCMEDIVINNTYFYDGQQQGQYQNMIQGCPRTEQCDPYTCSRHGSCVDLWDTFQCQCDRPYWGRQCEKEYTAATFYKDGYPSMANFSLPSNVTGSFESGLDISFFVRTRKEYGIILYLGNLGSDNTLTYITLEVRDSQLAVRLRLCMFGNLFPSSGGFLAGGSLNFVQLKFASSNLTLELNHQVVLNGTVPTSPCSLVGTSLLLGRVVPSSSSATGRKRRQPNTDMSAVMVLEPFNGVLQDVRLQGYKLDFYDRNASDGASALKMTDSQNLTIGAVSTVNICSTSQPCENGGTCHDVFFNDFSCDCPHGFLGKNCSRLDFCKNNSCPTWATCRSLEIGFECISTGSFSGVGSSVQYRQNLTDNLPFQQLSFRLRTQAIYGVVFEARAKDANYFIKVRLWEGSLEVNYLLKSGRSDVFHLKQHFEVNDGVWSEIEMDISNNSLVLQVSRNGSIVAESEPRALDGAVVDFATLVKNGTLTVGATADMKEQAFKGCLEEVRVGGILLPFVPTSQMVDNSAVQYFVASSTNTIQQGCLLPSPCITNVCRNGGQCFMSIAGYQCQCPAGYSGQYCQNNVNDCVTNACQNGGQCIDGVNAFTCKCRPGFVGTRCQDYVDSCSNSSSCSNTSQCVANFNITRGYVCNCSNQSFTGDFCNVTVHQNCTEGLCHNGGTCLANGSSFSCNCTSGFQGPLCESEVNFCASLPCKNGSNCTTSPSGYSCTCPTGWTGRTCDTMIKTCTNTTCKNGGTCADDDSCKCLTGWTGMTCENDTNECQSNPCARGNCLNTDGSYSCNCSNTGYGGQNCTVELNECDLGFCKNGSCNDTEGNYTCSCDLGYKGQNCSVATCEQHQCLNNSTCNVINNDTSWECRCLNYYTGKRCEYEGPCLTSPCNASNTDSCNQMQDFDPTNSSRQCVCKRGWKGDNCSDDVDECSNGTICKNGGTCNNTIGGFICSCVPGYNGSNCEEDINECASSPCQNGGNCSTPDLNSYVCNCNGTGYTGLNCTEDVNECDTGSPCKAGNCSNTPGNFTCLCGDLYLGSFCEHDNPCSRQVCANGGKCSSVWVQGAEGNGSYRYQCSCTEGYIGDTCEQSPQKSDGVEAYFIYAPIIAFVLLALLIGLIVFIMIAKKKRATRGAYSPSQQETAGSRVELGNVLKKPPEERLI